MQELPENALAALQHSVLFQPDFPRRARLTFSEFASLSEAQRQAVQNRSLVAIREASSAVRTIEHHIAVLAHARYAPAVATLIELWNDCALVPVRTRVGHALLTMQLPQGADALEALLDDYDSFSRYMAIRSVFSRYPDRAYDRFEPRLLQAIVNDPVPQEILRYLSPNAFGRDGPIWPDGAQAILERDVRWLDLCARFRRHVHLGSSARNVLRYAPSQGRDEALARARLNEQRSPQPLPAIVTTRNGTLLSRYKAGEFEAVWREIREVSAIDGEFRQEVLEVAAATMQRVAQNADLIAERLNARGWQPLSGELVGLRTQPTTSDDPVIRKMEEISGALLPPSLLAFWKHVGGINWVWDYHTEEEAPNLGVGLRLDELDPLCIDPPGVMDYLLEEWEDRKNQPDPDLVEPFSIDLAPDYLHKANISGGAPYAVLVPCSVADPILSYERHELPFIDYLRLAFRWAGFPGLEDHQERPDVRKFVNEFGRDLIPF